MKYCIGDQGEAKWEKRDGNFELERFVYFFRFFIYLFFSRYIQVMRHIVSSHLIPQISKPFRIILEWLICLSDENAEDGKPFLSLSSANPLPVRTEASVILYKTKINPSAHVLAFGRVHPAMFRQVSRILVLLYYTYTKLVCQIKLIAVIISLKIKLSQSLTFNFSK